MKHFITVIILIACNLPLFVISQNVSNVEASLEDNKVVINYSIQGGKFYNYYTISLFVSRDNGKTFEGPLKEVSGDVGENMRRGDHKIIWNAMKELPLVDQGFMFDVRAEVFEEKIKKSVFVAYVGNLVTPLGLRVGMLGKIGWYVEFRASLNPFNTASYTVKAGEFEDYDKPGYYEFNGNEGYSAYSAIAGITYQLSRDFFIYSGVGYGKEEYHWQIDEYTYESEAKTGQSYVMDDASSATGFELDVGGIMRFNKFLITAGCATINFQVYNWTAGIGIAF